MPESGFPPSRPSQLPLADPTRDLGAALHEVSNALTVVIGWIERARAEAGVIDGEPRSHPARPVPQTAPVVIDGEPDGREMQVPPALLRALEVASARASHARSIVRRAIEPEGASAGVEPSALVGAILADAITGLEVELGRAGLTPVSHVDARTEVQSVDMAITVLQILTNLLLNAIAMSPRGGRVTIEARPGAPGTVLFAVTDEGPGVPIERRASLFRAGVTTRAGGAGIGLRHAASLARVNGGALTLGETAPGSTGARFELAWPVGKATAPGSSAAPTPADHPGPPPPRAPLRSSPYIESPSGFLRAMPLAGTRILLVEDDDAVVDLLDTALTARGADVVSIRHRRDLAKALATGPFNVALFDISPIQDDVKGAVALTRDSVGSESRVRIVLISGSAARMPDMPDDWVAAWVRKPFEIAEILDALQPKL